jgi:methylenetetrahydrofolate reductase (NADPH)
MPNAVAVSLDRRQQVVDFLSGFTLETTPGSAARIADFRAHVRPGTRIYVTCLQGSDFDDTVAVARRLRREGFNPVPHIAARNIQSRAQLEAGLAALSGEVGIDEVLCIAGGASAPRGEFRDTMQLLETGLLDAYGITRIGVAGHPEGSPDIPDEAIARALRWKNDFARRTGARLYVVTQFCFEAAPIIAWDRWLQAEGSRLPVHIGIPGLATLRTLVKHATACGIGPSARFITRQAKNVARLMSVAAPDRLVAQLAAYKATDARCGIAGVHLYPLGGLEKSAEWAYAVIDGRFRMRPGDEGFDIGVAPA